MPRSGRRSKHKPSSSFDDSGFDILKFASLAIIDQGIPISRSHDDDTAQPPPNPSAPSAPPPLMKHIGNAGEPTEVEAHPPRRTASLPVTSQISSRPATRPKTAANHHTTKTKLVASSPADSTVAPTAHAQPSAKPRLELPAPSLVMGGLRPMINPEVNLSPIILEHNGSRLVPNREAPSSKHRSSAAGPSTTKPHHHRAVAQPATEYSTLWTNPFLSNYYSPQPSYDAYNIPAAPYPYSPPASPYSPQFNLNEYPIFGAYAYPPPPGPHPGSVASTPPEHAESLVQEQESRHESEEAYQEEATAEQGQAVSIPRLRTMVLGTPTTPSQSSELSPVVAIDCEMVGVGPLLSPSIRDSRARRSVLARVSIVDYDGHVLLDAYVKPDEPVTDYRTPVSGIRARDLKGDRAVTSDFARGVVKKILKGRIVVAHDIRQDLKVLKLTHPADAIRDTQQCPEVLRKHGYQRRVGLKALVQSELSLSIQQGEHSSVTDARASMALYRLFEAKWEDELGRAGRKNGGAGQFR